ncbi:Major facilitator superfamily domain, general substrate transporter [Penicillium expansum]|uniref:Major facilitator superfamily domain, general substrate transporter n=1 Tax=Penicillium expansum TaxID=27334 RepID=A0A0A2JE96_PENEN|nr:Major facilitator superfamily domain, general substrate transporter [Penicillium expansum]KGO53669.1 Major facilitator superfamily domain, general substrate transporter [Penicillium expansum]
MSAPTSHSEFNKNEAGHSPETSNLRIKERGSDETEGTGDLSQDLDQESDLEYATSFRLMIIMATLSLSTLIAALDLGIVATAIPKITSDFHALSDIGWYSSACFLLVGTTSAPWGKMYKYFSAQWTYMTALALYLIGSIVAAAAPTSIALIVGRALQGWGCAGTLGGSVLIINFTAHPKTRPMLIGLWMGVFMVATTIGPLIGGAFTTEATWRWCFWVNLPVGGTAIVLQFLFLRMPKHIKPTPATWKEILLHLDLPGWSLLFISIICLTLALEWGGMGKPWSNGSVIATLIVWVVLTIAFVVVEWFQGEYALMPLKMLSARITWSQLLYAFIANLANFQILFYLPIYFQAVHGMSAITSGVYCLPFMAFYTCGAIVSGGIVGKTRFLQPIEFTSGLIAVLGATLIYCIDVDTSKAWYIGAQIPFGLGIGLGNQVPVTALQGFATPETVAAITGVAFMAQSISGAYFVSAANSIFNNYLLQTLARIAPQIDPAEILHIGVSDIANLYKGEQLNLVREAYMAGIKDVFAFALAGTVLTVVFSLLIPFKRLPSHQIKKTEDIEASAKAL